MNDIRLILSDLDGVIRLFPSDRDRAIEAKYQLAPLSIATTAFEPELIKKVVCGFLTDEEWRNEIINRLSVKFGRQTSERAVFDWSNFSGELNREYLNILKANFGDLPLALITNGTNRLGADLRALGIANSFVKIFNSSDLGICKPDPKIFEVVLDFFNYKPCEILFIDDSISHVNSALQMGFKVHHFSGTELLKDFLKNQKFQCANENKESISKS